MHIEKKFSLLSLWRLEKPIESIIFRPRKGEILVVSRNWSVSPARTRPALVARCRSGIYTLSPWSVAIRSTAFRHTREGEDLLWACHPERSRRIQLQHFYFIHEKAVAWRTTVFSCLQYGRFIRYTAVLSNPCQHRVRLESCHHRCY